MRENFYPHSADNILLHVWVLKQIVCFMIRYVFCVSMKNMVILSNEYVGDRVQHAVPPILGKHDEKMQAKKNG